MQAVAMQEPAERLVSVVMVNRDKAPYVGEAIRSVWEQGVRDLELLIVDNGSRDSSQREIKRKSWGMRSLRCFGLERGRLSFGLLVVPFCDPSSNMSDVLVLTSTGEQLG